MVALETRNKRAAAIGLGTPWNRVWPDPDGSLDTMTDRQHMAFLLLIPRNLYWVADVDDDWDTTGNWSLTPKKR